MASEDFLLRFLFPAVLVFLPHIFELGGRYKELFERTLANDFNAFEEVDRIEGAEEVQAVD